MTLDPFDFPLIGWPTAKLLADRGVPNEVLARLTQLRVVTGMIGDDGLLDLDERGEPFLAFYCEASQDVVFWCIETGELATWRGRAFALGEDNLRNAATYAFDCHLHVHAGALEWLVDRGRGIVVLRWDLAFDLLRDVPRSGPCRYRRWRSVSDVTTPSAVRLTLSPISHAA